VTETAIIPFECIATVIHVIRGQKVMLDRDLAKLYGVSTKALKQAVRRNADRFPEDFMFVLTQGEMGVLRSQTVTSKTETRGGTQYAPMAFTEQGVAMLSSVLNSQRAIEVNIAIIRAFVRLREFLASQAKLGKKLAEIERRIEEHHESIHVLFEAIQQLTSERPPAIGFQYVGTDDARSEAGKTVKERCAKYRTPRVKRRVQQG
jgi:phage regulator Rha-like protein